ncbi:MAG: AMP-binding protein, partial [Ilumatobacter fluminis]
MIGLWNLARANPSHVAAIETDTGRSVTRGELAARTHQVVNALRERGMKEGSVIGIVLENEIPFLEVFFAGLQAGWYVVPLNYHFTSDEIGYI